MNTLLLANPYLDKSENAHFLLLQNLAIIGGLFYLLGEEPIVSAKKVPQAKPEPTSNETLTNSSSNAAGKEAKKDKKKK